MSIFRRDKNKNSPTKSREAGKTSNPRPPQETSPQRVGVVSGVLTTTATSDAEQPGSGIVDRHFGPNGQSDRSSDEAHRVDADAKKTRIESNKNASGLPPRHEHLRAVETPYGNGLAEEDLESPRLEIDPMAHIGHATTITGNIVAEEDLEVQGTIEGAVRLANHELTVGKDGHVKASVEAHTVLVVGRISGDVVASELIEIKAGGIIGGDVKAPRIIMHDGGVVVGGMDMSASLPSSAELSKSEPPMPERPKLKSVESARESSIEADERI